MKTHDTSQRMPSLDTLRGLLIVTVVLEHARQILTGVGIDGTWGMPEMECDLAGLIRVVSHIAAPGFFLLMGMGVELKSRKGAGFSHFLRRGLLLVLLQFVVENIGWALSMPGGLFAQSFTLYFGVLFALGVGMVICAAVKRLPSVLLAGLAMAMIASPYWMPHGSTDFPVCEKSAGSPTCSSAGANELCASMLTTVFLLYLECCYIVDGLVEDVADVFVQRYWYDML